MSELALYFLQNIKKGAPRGPLASPPEGFSRGPPRGLPATNFSNTSKKSKPRARDVRAKF